MNLRRCRNAGAHFNSRNGGSNTPLAEAVASPGQLPEGDPVIIVLSEAEMRV